MRNAFVLGILIVASRGGLFWRSVAAAEKPELLVLRAGVPVGFLGHPVGTRLSVEGRRAGFNTALQVTAVNGKPLGEPVIVWTLGHRLADGPIRLIGYEKPMMIGQAPAEVPAGQISVNPHAWSLAGQFVVLPDGGAATQPGDSGSRPAAALDRGRAR